MDAAVLRGAVASLFDDTPDAVVLYDSAGHAVGANEATGILAGYELSEFLGTHFEAHIAPRDVDRVRIAFKTALAGGTDHFDTSARHKDGSIIPVECYVYPARFGDDIVGVFAQARDIVALRSAEASLTINQEKFRSLFEYHPDGIMELKDSGSISRVNVALESETGYYGEQVVGKAWTELIAPEMRESADAFLRAALRGEAEEHDSLILDRLGNRLEVQLKLVPLHSRGEIHGAYAIFKNIAAQKDAERAIASHGEQLRRLYLVAAAHGKSLDEQIDGALGLGTEMFGWDQGYVTQIVGETIVVRNAVGESTVNKGNVYPLSLALTHHLLDGRDNLFIDDMDEPHWRNDPARSSAPWKSYFAVPLTVNGTLFGGLSFAGRTPREEPLSSNERDMVQLMGLFVSAALERAAQNERIEMLAFNDSLTGLPNRVLFNDRIEQTIATARRYERGFAVMFIDVDKFKHINDRFGHAVGDSALCEVAQRLRMTTRESDTVSRFGGDEFVILQPVVDGPSDAADLARKLNVAMQAPVVIDGVMHKVTVSIGISMYPNDGDSVDVLMEAADRALYRAKKEGRNRWCFVDAAAARKNLKTPIRREAAE